MLQANEIEGVYAIVPTPAKEGADHWSATDTVDVDASVAMIDRLVTDGVDAIIALGTTGECATLTDAEWHTFADAVIDTTAGRVPLFIGATTLGTHQTVERLRHLQRRGVTGTMLGLPMWQPCTEDMAVKFYAQVSEAFPDLAVMVYMNTGAFRFDFSVSFWERVVQVAPTVTSAKWTRTTPHADCVAATGGRVNFIPIDMSMLPVAKAAPDTVTACWSTAASMGPEPALALMDAVAVRDWDRAEAVNADIAWANETFMPPNPADFSTFNIQIEKLRMVAAGYCSPGPLRPPYDVVSDELRVRAAENGRRWAEIAAKYRGAR